MARYQEIYGRHRLLLSAPIVVALLAGLLLVAGQPRSYESTARIWVDDPAQVAATATGTPPPQEAWSQTLTPAERLSASLKAMLQSRSFADRVSSRGPLSGYLASARPAHDGDSLAVVSELAVRLHLRSQAALGFDAAGQRAYDLLTHNTRIATSGPQMVTVAFRSTDKAVAAGTAQAIADQYIDDSVTGQRARAAASADFYSQQVKAQAGLVDAALAGVAAYLSAHPEQTRANPPPDVNLANLRNAADQATQRYNTVLAKSSQAQLESAALARSDGGLRVIDRAGPAGALGIAQVLIYTLGGALATGALITIVGLIALALSERPLPQPMPAGPAGPMSASARARRSLAGLPLVRGGD